VNRLVIFHRSLDNPQLEVVSDEEARAVPDDQLPLYTVMIPAYREPQIIRLLLEHLARLEYPVARLDVKLLLEADDEETIAAVRRSRHGDHIQLVLVPAAAPRTKPKALNYGLGLARGELVTIFDAEDEPDPLQLRRAAVAMARLGPEVACLQAKLAYSNVEQNLITRWFSLEYAMWFSYFLPGLASLGAPLPLGGTSNHFRRHVLEHVGAWDPHNVTEDADLGLRLHREGYEVRVLESTTLEEANSDFVNWIKQRSRWYKGYAQTFLVHVREPVQLTRELGWLGALEVALFVGGTPLLALLSPLFWTLTVVWFVAQPHLIKAAFPAPVFYTGLTCWAFGNFAIAYLTLATCRAIRRPDLLVAALLVPLYWVMMWLAAIKGFLQLVATPSFWEKTTHGLHLQQADDDESAAA
jgi:cellulose synthase/poly-beta-1,6-N-acetylglucosamine synthase-like glycosyltransferase